MKANLKTLLAFAGISLTALGAATALAQPGAAASQPAGRALERFQATDTNKDGFLSKDEATAGMPGLAQRFDTIDSNKDGKLSLEEFQAQRGNLRGTGPQAARGGPHHGMRGGARQEGCAAGMRQAGFHGAGGMLAAADTDKDGVITRAEAEKFASARATARFDALDTNKDGKLTADERAACPAAPR